MKKKKSKAIFGCLLDLLLKTLKKKLQLVVFTSDGNSNICNNRFWSRFEYEFF